VGGFNQFKNQWLRHLFIGLPSLRSGILEWGASTRSKTNGFAIYFFVSMYSLKQAWLII
jgi:hypothetical protein